MTPTPGQIVQGDALEVLRGWPEASVQTAVTSPPYWALRDYQVEGESLAGQYGQEATIEEWIAVLVAVFAEVRRVLRPDGTLWLNCGDAYYNGGGIKRDGGHQFVDGGKRKLAEAEGTQWGVAGKVEGLGPKNLLMLPARLAMALQADGWTLRSSIVWNKPNPMPESVTDRPASAHEYVFLLTPGPRYFYDAEAVREPAIHAGKTVTLGDKSLSKGQARGAGVEPSGNGNADSVVVAAGRNLRNVWTIATQPYAGAHYATFPNALVQPCIAAGTSEKGACPACGAPWRRVVEKDTTLAESRRGDADYQSGGIERGSHFASATPGVTTTTRTIGWEPACGAECIGSAEDLEPVPCIVMDPFAGSGTVGVVAYKMGREFVGIDLAGGDADLGGHTAHDRINAARDGGRSVAEHVGHRQAGQLDMLGGTS